jgi:hypothetical protein
MPTPVIDVDPGHTWRNWHSTGGVGGAVQKFFTPDNAYTDGSLPPAGKPFQPGLEALQSIVRQAQADKRRVRALGSGWSLSSIGFVGDYLVNTSRLSSWFLGFRTATYVDPSQRADKDRLVFAQCGIQIKTLNTYLESNGLAMPTSGASNGQTIAGAVSTGTHGSARDVGAMQDTILAIHLVGENGVHYWIERPSAPAMTQSFADWLGAKLVRDEDLFLSALVGFGSFGIVHGLLFKAEPLYLLELFIANLDHDQVLHAACTRDVSGLGLPDGDAVVPFHFEVVFNPYLRGQGQKGAFVRAIYKRPLVGAPPTPPPTDGPQILGRDLVSIAGKVSDDVPELVPRLLQSQLLGSVPPTAPGTRIGTPGILFGDSQPTNGGTSVEIGVPLDRTKDALDVIFGVTAQHVFGAPVALRYVRPSDALLAFTCHAPTTTTIEMPGVDSTAARTAHALVFAGLAAAGIPATYHWGQQSPYTPASLASGFGAARVARWKAARQAFLSPEGRRTFSNDILDACGLST